MFKDKMLNRFQRYDPNRKYIWVLTMNIINRKYLAQNCAINKINFIPISQHLTPQTINPLVLKGIFITFINDLSVFLDDVLNGIITP